MFKILEKTFQNFNDHLIEIRCEVIYIHMFRFKIHIILHNSFTILHKDVIFIIMFALLLHHSPSIFSGFCSKRKVSAKCYRICCSLWITCNPELYQFTLGMCGIRIYSSVNNWRLGKIVYLFLEIPFFYKFFEKLRILFT